jgi:hypothetical protein
MSLDGGVRNNKEKAQSGSRAKEGNSFKITTAIVIPVLAIVIPAIVAIYIARTSGDASGNQPQNNAPSSGQLGDPPSSVAKGNASLSVSAPTSHSAKTGNVSTGTTGHILMYQSNELILDNDGCNDHNNYPNAIFGPYGLEITASTPSPPSGAFGVTLYCSATSSGAGFDPNLEYGGQAAILSGEADFNSCYLGIANSPFEGSIPFGTLRPEVHLCILKDNELALVTLLSVSQTEYRLTGTVTVWKVLPSN